MAAIAVEYRTGQSDAVSENRAGLAFDPALRKLVARAAATVSAHVERDGMCACCLEDWARLAPVPCEWARWGHAVLEAYGPMVAADNLPDGMRP